MNTKGTALALAFIVLVFVVAALVEEIRGER